MKLRLDKFLSLAGLGSRKQVKTLILKGKIKVNQEIIFQPDIKIDPEMDRVSFEGKEIKYQKFYYYKLYKPPEVLTSTKDKEKTVKDLLPPDLPGYRELFPAGRLDKDAEGLILLTNDGELGHRITHPKWKIPKVYEIEIDKSLEEEDKIQIERGVDLKEGKTKPAKIEFLSLQKTRLKIEVTEGRHHLLKRIFGKLGYRVLKIKRIEIGPLKIGDLQPGEWKPLTEKEISALKGLLTG
ncbi:RNA-binding protein S4 [Caldimicrobium thiodismutans]|uniref:Pseudouridine synthase n=1 Tax=Caldimicrobium thiodismutans TaxID=1653476 RepID=A0A0U4W4Z8_9BACT|nr:pseudouridine synthase [Caldimicrobium thiodismutans]BAU24141.1 RNA-binding protein S4 [Caldimicrobium thiodismutans]